jgi:hypothetical protein
MALDISQPFANKTVTKTVIDNLNACGVDPELETRLKG